MDDYKKPDRENRRLFWEEQITEWEKSGLTKKEYCIRHNLKYTTFNDWGKRLTESNELTHLVKLPQKTVQALRQQKRSLEIIINESISIKIDHNFDNKLLQRVLQLLGVM